jgi:hypothetical protein
MRKAFYAACASKDAGARHARRRAEAAQVYNFRMNKPASRRLRRTALWVAFAALAGFLLADLT